LKHFDGRHFANSPSPMSQMEVPCGYAVRGWRQSRFPASLCCGRSTVPGMAGAQRLAPENASASKFARFSRDRVSDRSGRTTLSVAKKPIWALRLSKCRPASMPPTHLRPSTTSSVALALPPSAGTGALSVNQKIKFTYGSKTTDSGQFVVPRLGPETPTVSGAASAFVAHQDIGVGLATPLTARVQGFCPGDKYQRFVWHNGLGALAPRQVTERLRFRLQRSGIPACAR
jgi:hypothetical protein